MMADTATRVCMVRKALVTMVDASTRGWMVCKALVMTADTATRGWMVRKALVMRTVKINSSRGRAMSPCRMFFIHYKIKITIVHIYYLTAAHKMVSHTFQFIS